MNKIDWWAILRYVLIAGGTAIATSGPNQQYGITQGDIQNVVGAVIAAASAIWGIYVKYNTAAVPVPVAERADIPVQSSATGQIREGPGV